MAVAAFDDLLEHTKAFKAWVQKEEADFDKFMKETIASMDELSDMAREIRAAPKKHRLDLTNLLPLMARMRAMGAYFRTTTFAAAETLAPRVFTLQLDLLQASIPHLKVDCLTDETFQNELYEMCKDQLYWDVMRCTDQTLARKQMQNIRALLFRYALPPRAWYGRWSVLRDDMMQAPAENADARRLAVLFGERADAVAKRVHE